MYAIKAARPPGLAAFAFDARRSARELPLPSCRFASSHTPPFVAMRHLPPERGKSSLKGTAFGGGGKVSGIAQRRPLGGAGCEHSEQTEGVPAARLFPQETSAVAAVSLHDPTRENAFGALSGGHSKSSRQQDTSCLANAPGCAIIKITYSIQYMWVYGCTAR